MRRRDLLARAGASATGGFFTSSPRAIDTYWPSVVIGWNAALTSSIAATVTGPTVAARAMSVVYEAVYNAWAAYRPDANFTLTGLRKRPVMETQANWKSIAVSHAAYIVLSDLFPGRIAQFDLAPAQALTGLSTTSLDGVSAMQTGQLAGGTLLQTRASAATSTAIWRLAPMPTGRATNR